MKKQKAHIIKTFDGYKEGDWVWCLHCERTYQVGEFRVIHGLQMCPYQDCNGDAVIDVWRWSSIREANPDYPNVPQKDVLYPQYGYRQGGEKKDKDEK